MLTPGERFDYSSERERHKAFVGRADLLARLDELLVNDQTDSWVVITGGPGMGKSALLAAWLARREAAGAVVPHHFIRRATEDSDDPVRLVDSLVAQLEKGFADLGGGGRGEGASPTTRLARALSCVSEKILKQRKEPLVVLIDGLDEYEPQRTSPTGDPFRGFLPDALPSRVRLLCASRRRHRYVSSLHARDGVLTEIDLDHRDNARDNEATVLEFWKESAKSLELDTEFVKEAGARAGGNIQHAVQLRKRLAALPHAQRRVEDIPRGLEALIEQTWARIAVDPVVVNGLGILCAAREALTLDELGAVAGWATVEQRRTFEHAAREVLLEITRPDKEIEYRLHHDSIREYVAHAIGKAALREHHRALAHRHAVWPGPRQGAARRYALRHALIHRAEASDWADAWQIAGDASFLEAKARELGAHETEADITRIAEHSRASDSAAISRRFGDLARALARESHWLRIAPEATAALVWNRLHRSGWSAIDLEQHLRVTGETSFLRVRHAASHESPELVRDLVDHADSVTACAVTADDRVISASEDRTLKVWDLKSGRVLDTLTGPESRASACAVTPDGQRVISASEDGTLKVWDLEGKRTPTTLQGHTGRVTACAVMPDGKRVVSASEDGTLKVWDLENGRSLVTLKGHTDAVMACAVIANGERVVSASRDRTLKVWDVEKEWAFVTLKGHSGAVNACGVTANGSRVISASGDETVKIWDLQSESALATLTGHTGEVRACAVTADGRRVVSASDDRTLKVWDIESGHSITTLEGHTDVVGACVVTPDGRHVISASADKKLKVWDLETKHVHASVKGHSDFVMACGMTADGRVVSASQDSTLKVWSPEDGRVLATLQGHTNFVMGCAVTTDGRIVSASWDRTLRVWDLDSGSTISVLQGHTDHVNACAVIPGGQRAVSASSDGTLKIWDLESGCALTILSGHTDGVWACAVTPDGRRVVSASSDQTLRVWDLGSGSEIVTLRGHTDRVWACAVTPDGRRVVSASNDRTLRVWDLGSGSEIATLSGHTERVWACAVTPNGQRVVSASSDQTLRVWDLETYTCVYVHRGDAPYLAVAASATLVAAGDRASALWFLAWPAASLAVQAGSMDGDNDEQSKSPPNSVAERPGRRAMRHTILFLAANPFGAHRLALDQEARAIHDELKRCGFRDCFELVTRWASKPLDLLRELRELKPTVVHFSGHGGIGNVQPNGVLRRDVVGESEQHRLDRTPRLGLWFQGADGWGQLVSTEALDQTFGAAGSSVKLIVLNACYSEVQAEALLAHVDCVVGMSGSIGDDAARNFAIGFYGGLGTSESIAAAYRQGCAAISLDGLSDSEQPRLKVRDGVDASRIVLAQTLHSSP